MGNWRICTIGDLGTVVGGATPSTKKTENYDGGTIAWITPKDLAGFSSRFISHGERYITEQGLKSCSTHLLPPHTVLFSSRAPIGYVAIAEDELCTNQGFKSVIPNKNTDYMFLYYLLKYNKGKIENLGSGTTFKEISGTTMRGIEVSIPETLEEQRQIASTLSVLDEKIEKNITINKNLESQAQAIFKSWFVDFEPFDGEMPRDWKYGNLEDLGQDIVCGKTPSTKRKEYYGGNIPFVTIPDMHNQIYITETERYLSIDGVKTQPTKTLPKNTICVSCIGTAGLVSLTSKECQTNQQINSIIPKDHISPYYVYFLMKSLSETIIRLGGSGSTIVNLNKGQFAKIEVVIPNLEDMSKFTYIVKSNFEMILSNQIENTRLAALRDTLLPRLMSGEIDVGNIEL